MALNQKERDEIMAAAERVAEKAATKAVNKKLLETIDRLADAVEKLAKGKIVEIMFKPSESTVKSNLSPTMGYDPDDAPLPSEDKTPENKAPEDLTADDVRAALRTKATTDGKETAKAVLKKFKAASVSDLKQSQYADVIDACVV